MSTKEMAVVIVVMLAVAAGLSLLGVDLLDPLLDRLGIR